MSINTKDKLLFRLTEELGSQIVELDKYVIALTLLPGLGVNKAHIEQLWTIRAKATRLKRIQHALLDIQKIEHGILSLSKNENSLRGIIIDAVSSLKHVSDSRQVKIRMDIVEDMICNCDKNKMESVLNNLIINSIDFCPQSNGEVIITLSKDGENGIISVKDNGIGIREEVVKLVFDSNYQMELAIKREHVESGLALPVCKAIIEAHQGKIWTESAGTDLGTSIIITIPKNVSEGIRKLD